MTASSTSLPRCLPFVLLTVLVASACVGPTTNLAGVSPEVVRAEQLKQQQLVLRSDIGLQRRVDDIGYGLLGAALPLCTDMAGLRRGVRFANLHSYPREYQPAAAALGFNDTLMIVGVARGSAAEGAGVRLGDRVIALSGRPAPVGRNADRNMVRVTADLEKDEQPVLGIGLRAGPLALTDPGSVTAEGAAAFATTAAEGRTVEIPADTVCNFNLTAVKDDQLNAGADGRNVIVTSAMMRFAADDEELATILAHEIAHNAMDHIDASKTNSMLGALFGAVLDVAAASQGVNTGGEFTSQGARIGAMVFSQDFEREADYVGLYILARAGRPIASAPNFWRRLAQENPASIKYASTHPTTAERFVRLEQALAEIERKRSAGEPLMPEMLAKADP